MPSGVYVRTPEICASLSAARKREPLNNPRRMGRVYNPFPKGNQLGKGHKYGYKHGLSFHPLYLLWDAMTQRCCNPKAKSYTEYGGLNPPVTIWESWRKGEIFIRGVLNLIGNRPKGMTLDRINPWEGYYPWNIRWADKKTQTQNRRKNIPFYHSQPGEH
jgi:hypothetical protein